ncbi:MAG: Bro-N domain-containing protein [Candidatus Peregrinibacteria bacterium]|nr:Bro-N domain-containing protein [Candidatus Peregrinibacteria bacterium]
MENKEIALFENRAIRRVWHEKEWWFSIVDVVEVLTDSPNSRRYWSDLKRRVEAEENSQLYAKIVQLKITSADGKKYLTDCANREGILRIIQSIPSPKAEPFKLWLAKIGKERLDEIKNPMLAEATTTELHKTRDSVGFKKLHVDAHEGGKIAGRTRKDIEKKTGKPVPSSENFLGLKKQNKLKSGE